MEGPLKPDKWPSGESPVSEGQSHAAQVSAVPLCVPNGQTIKWPWCRGDVAQRATSLCAVKGGNQ